MSISVAYPYTFFLLFIRILSFLMTAPLFSQRSLPALVKIFLAGLLAFVITPVTGPAAIPEREVVFFALIVQEALLGLLLGFVTNIPIWAVGLMGRLIASAMGMSYATSVSPMFPDAAPPLGQFYMQLTLVFFVIIRADHAVLLALKRMADLLPPGQFLSQVLAVSNDVLVERSIYLTSQLWAVSVQLALPVIGAIFLADLALVLIGRAMPRMNVFAQSLVLKVLMGLLVMTLAFPLLWPQIVSQVDKTGHQMLALFR